MYTKNKKKNSIVAPYKQYYGQGMHVIGTSEMVHESFDSDLDFEAHIANYLIHQNFGAGL